MEQAAVVGGDESEGNRGAGEVGECLVDQFEGQMEQAVAAMQHGDQRIKRATTLGAGLGIMGLDQIDQRFPRDHFLHLAQKSLPPGALLGCGLLVITNPSCLLPVNPGLRLQAYFRMDRPSFPKRP